MTISVPALVRDQFLATLDAGDRAASMELATHLVSCAATLPGITCDELDLPRGSTYGAAARRVLLLYRS